MSIRQFAQQGFHAQHKARRHDRRTFVAQGMAQHDFGRTHRGSEIMCGKANAEIRARHTQSAQHGTVVAARRARHFRATRLRQGRRI